MALSPEEKQTAERLKEQGFNSSQISGYIAAERRGAQSSTHRQLTSSPEEPGVFRRVVSDIPNDLRDAFRGSVDAVSRGRETATTARQQVTDHEISPVAGTAKTIGGALRAGAEVVGQGVLGLGKMFTTQKAEDAVGSTVEAVASEVAQTEPVQAITQYYESLPAEQKAMVDGALGTAEGLASIFGGSVASKGFREGVGAAQTGSRNLITRVRTAEPEIDTPYVQQTEQAIAEGIDKVRHSPSSDRNDAPKSERDKARETPGVSAAFLGDAVVDAAVAGAQKTTQTYRRVREGATQRIIARQDRAELQKNASLPLAQVEANIADMYINSVSPGVKGKRKTQVGITQNTQSAVQAVRDITQNKSTLKFRDLEENQYITGELPSNLWEFGGAVVHQKSEVWQQIAAKIDQTGGASTDTSRIVAEMQAIIDDPVYAGIPEVKRRAEQALQQFNDNTYAPADIERLIQLENDRLQAFYRGSGTQADAIVSAIVANNLRDILDETVERATGEGIKDLKQRYGNLKAIERDVVHRALHNSQAREAGLIDMFGIQTIGDIALGSAGDITALKRGAAQLAGESFVKALNDRDAMVNRMFLVADQAYQTPVE